MIRTFRDFMHAELYGDSGYYSSGKVEFGARGDFYTTSQVHALFGELLADEFARYWMEDGSPSDYAIVELGPGNGDFAHDVLGRLRSHHGKVFDSIAYFCCEISPALAAQQKEKLEEFAAKVEWTADLSVMVPRSGGVVFSNEFFDALPCHVLQQRDGSLKELYVGTDGERMGWVAGELSSPEVGEAWQRSGTKLREGQRAEVSVDALGIINALSRMMTSAHMITIDYGDMAEALYSEDRYDGTLRCFRKHEITGDPFQWRDCDITASVNFTLLADAGRDAGFEVRRFVRLPEYLTSLGVLERAAEVSRLAKHENPRELQKRLALKQLFLPQGIAGSFKVLETFKRG